MRAFPSNPSEVAAEPEPLRYVPFVNRRLSMHISSDTPRAFKRQGIVFPDGFVLSETSSTETLDDHEEYPSIRLVGSTRNQETWALQEPTSTHDFRIGYLSPPKPVSDETNTEYSSTRIGTSEDGSSTRVESTLLSFDAPLDVEPAQESLVATPVVSAPQLRIASSIAEGLSWRHQQAESMLRREEIDETDIRCTYSGCRQRFASSWALAAHMQMHDIGDAMDTAAPLSAASSLSRRRKPAPAPRRSIFARLCCISSTRIMDD